jgi:hypothetical protein
MAQIVKNDKPMHGVEVNRAKGGIGGIEGKGGEALEEGTRIGDQSVGKTVNKQHGDPH